MANPNVEGSNVPSSVRPTRSDEQILPYKELVTIGKSNCFIKPDKFKTHPLFQLAVDILKQTTFYRAFTASAIIPSIYIQQFCNTISYDRVARTYQCQLDEQQIDITKETLENALGIMPTGDNVEFITPHVTNELIAFVNELGYPSDITTVSQVVTYDMLQPWRAVASLINLCLTGKTSGYERIQAPILQILWGVIYNKNIDLAERIWEEFTLMRRKMLHF